MIVTKQIIYRGKLIDVNNLKPNSDMRILVECPICNVRRIAYYKSVRNNQVCHKCAIRTKLSKQLQSGNKYGRLTIVLPYDYTKSVCICDCGTEIIIDNYTLSSGHTNSCGCLRSENAKKVGKDIISKWHGENHPNWKGGITSERQRFNASKEAKEWKQSVFKRDNYTCQHCGQVGYVLNAHHIKQFSTHNDLKLDINNGITLCEKCHKAEHKRMGKKKKKIIQEGEHYEFK